MGCSDYSSTITPLVALEHRAEKTPWVWSHGIFTPHSLGFAAIPASSLYQVYAHFHIMHTVSAQMGYGLWTRLDLVWDQVFRLCFLQFAFQIKCQLGILLLGEGELLLWAVTPIVRRYVIILVHLSCTVKHPWEMKSISWYPVRLNIILCNVRRECGWALSPHPLRGGEKTWYTLYVYSSSQFT